MVSVVKLAYKDAVEAWLGAKTISRSWAESPCTCAKFNEIPEMDGPTDTHKLVEMRCEISCLVLRCSAIRVYCCLHAGQGVIEWSRLIPCIYYLMIVSRGLSV